jgi:hypothetical protein
MTYWLLSINTLNNKTMKKNFFATFYMTFILMSSVHAQKENPDLGIQLSGYVKNDVFYDSRQTVDAREGHFLLWPAPELPDANQQDINKQAGLNILSVQSRISGTITGPDALGATTSGKIEGDFFAQANDNINLFRLRHAFVRFSWQKSQLLFGQYWNPLFVTSCFPATISFNTGVPIQPFARNPQIRFMHNFGNFNLIAAALAQRDYPSRIDQEVSSKFLRNSAIPDMHLQLHYQTTQFNAGAGMAYKTIIPRLSTNQNTKTNQRVGGISGLAFAKISLKPLTIKFEAVSGQNITDLLQISGFAVETVNPTTDQRSYLPINNMSVWTDIHTNGSDMQFGLFAGYTENLGTKSTIINDEDYIFGFGQNIRSLYRISPRMLFNYGNARFALEGEYTSAAFGNSYNENAIPLNTQKVANLRMLFSTYYFF